jgi:hypothetical protein
VMDAERFFVRYGLAMAWLPYLGAHLLAFTRWLNYESSGPLQSILPLSFLLPFLSAAGQPPQPPIAPPAPLNRRLPRRPPTVLHPLSLIRAFLPSYCRPTNHPTSVGSAVCNGESKIWTLAGPRANFNLHLQ